MFYVVGVGPGSIDLLTVKAFRLLTEADFVFYVDGLYFDEILQCCKADCEKISLKDFPMSKQIELVKANPDKVILRLHTGDLSLESGYTDLLEVLHDNNVAFECVPGISSVSAVAAKIGLDYLMEGLSTSFSVVLPSDVRVVPEGQNIASIAAHSGAVVVFGVHPDNIELVVNELKAAGRAGESRVVLASRVGQADEQFAFCELDHAAETMFKEKFGRFTLLISL